MRRGLDTFLCTLEFCPPCPWYKITGSSHLCHTSTFPISLPTCMPNFSPFFSHQKPPQPNMSLHLYMCFQQRDGLYWEPQANRSEPRPD